MPREGIGRFSGKSEYSDVEFLEIFKELLPYVKAGKIDLSKVKNIDVVEKMDSAFCHFGINDHGTFFIETSNSGEVTVDNYRQKFSNEYFFGDFKASFESLLGNTILQNALKKISAKFGPIRYDAEIFPVLTHTGDDTGYITFVATRYDKNKFGKNGAFVVFKSWIKDENAQWKRPDPKTNHKLIAAIETADSADWRIYTNEKHAKLSGNIEFKIDNLDEMLSTEEGIDEALTVLKSRGNTTMKAHLKNAIRDAKDKLQSVLDAYAEKTSSIFSKAGEKSPIEGVVLRLKQADGSIFEVKGTSKAFDELKKQTWATRMDLGSLEEVTDGRFLKDALGLSTAQPAALNNAIKKLAQSFTSDEKDAEKKELQFLFKLYESLKDAGAMSSPEETKQKVNAVFESATEELTKIIDAFKANAKSLDPDTRRKTTKAIEIVIDKFQKIEEAIQTDIPPEIFQIYILKFFLERRLNTYAAAHMNKPTTDFSKYYEGQTPVILWNGRAQPWHRGHDAMIQLAKDKLKEVGAEKVLIFIVKGGETSKNKEDNPLNEAEQKQLIQAIYKNDPAVSVAPVPLPTSTSSAIWARIEPLKMYVAGWLAGEDRIEDYKKDVARFNANLWVQDHASLPLKVNDRGTSAVAFIQTPRVMSGTAARESAKTTDFQTWVANVCPPHALKDNEVIEMYNDIYNKLNIDKKEAVESLVRSKFSCKLVEAEPAPANPPADTNKPAEPPKPENPKQEEPKQEFTPEVIALADAIDKERKLSPENIDDIIKKLGSDSPQSDKNDTPVPQGTAGDAVDPEKNKQEQNKKLEDKLNSIKVTNIDGGTADMIKKIILKKAQNKEPLDLKSIQQDIEAENNQFKHTPDTDGAIQHILDQAKDEITSVSASQAEFNSKKYNTLMRKTFNEKVFKVINELQASDIELQKIIQSIDDMIKKDPSKKKDVIEALKYLKSEATKLPDKDKPVDVETKEINPTEELPENKKPEPYASMMGNPDVISDLSTIFKTALSMVAWVVSKENEKAGSVLSAFNGGIARGLDKINDLVKKGQSNADEMNKELKSSFRKLQQSEKTMERTYNEIVNKAKAAGKNPDDLIKAAREKRNIEDLKKNSDAKQLKQALDKWKKSTGRIDSKFIAELKKTIPNYDTLIQSATNSKDPKYAESEKNIVTAIKKYLLGSGETTYPYLSEMVDSGDQDEVIKNNLIELKGNIASPLHMPADRVTKLKEITATGEMDSYFLAEETINDALDSLSRLYLTVKKKIDIKEIKDKTKLSARTINNWINRVKDNPYDDKIIKAIGNQQAQ